MKPSGAVTSDFFKNVKGILLDLDGVVHIGDTPIPGAVETLAFLERRNIPVRFVTNTTTKSPENLHRQMVEMGLPIRAEAILTTHRVAAQYLKRLGRPTCHLLVAEQALSAYEGIPTSDTAPEHVVIGDIGERWNYKVLNGVFNMIMEGAGMIALHKGRYWKTEDGIQMDIGAFVAGLEYVTGKTATVIGKPSPTFFETALELLAVPMQHAIMIGDDIETDVGGAQAFGIRGVLVKTGKYRKDAVARSAVRPEAVLDSIADLQRWL
jgi:HAD superfamily hydrolase (TIGR01458 family)